MFIKLSIFYGSYLIFPFVLFLILKYKQQKRKKYFNILLLISIFFIYARFVEPLLLNVVETKIILNNQNSQENIKVALISDLHIGVYKKGSSLRRVVNKINQQSPDLVFIAGDILYDLKRDQIKKELSELQNLKAETYVITGNHDSGFPGVDERIELEKVFNEFNIKVLDNKIHSIAIHGKLIHLVGFSDIWTDEIDYQLLDMVQEEETVFVLAHNPDTVYNFQNPEKVDLVLAGHTHGGQIRIPFIYKYAIPCEYGFDKGFYEINNMKIFVSPGLGMVGLPMRFLMVPEIDILALSI